MLGKQNDALLPIHVEKTQSTTDRNVYTVTFGKGVELGKVVATALSGEGTTVHIDSISRGELLSDLIPDDDLIFEANEIIHAFKGFYERYTMASITLEKREK